MEQQNNEIISLYNRSFRELQEGEILSAEVVHIDREKEFVLVDIGYKTEGIIPIKEFLDEDGRIQVKVGDRIEAMLVQKDEERDLFILSKEKARQLRTWRLLDEVYKNDRTVKGVIKEKTKGGFFVDIDGVRAFLPGSQLDVRPVKDWDSFIGTEHEFKIIKYEKQKKNVVLSRKAAIEQRQKIMREKTLSKIKEGEVLEGKVKNVVDYGIFVDLGGVDGLVHITDICWGRINKDILNLYKPGDQVKVKVLRFDREKERISLGIKQLTPDPWKDAEKKYPVGKRLKAKVVALKEYGAFVELEPGVEGLVHISEMSWTKKIKHPSEVVEVGDIVDVVVLDINPEKRRIALGMKQVEPNPWDILEEKYPVGSRIKGKVRGITDFGIFVGVEEGIDGLVHISDISWTRKKINLHEMFKIGDEVEAVVLNIDKENRRFSLGIKQLIPNPWELITKRYKPGDTVKGTITSITDFGIFVDVGEGVEGLIHVSEIPEDTPLSEYKEGEEVEAKILSISPREKKIALSIKRLEEKRVKREEFRTSLAEILREKNVKLEV